MSTSEPLILAFDTSAAHCAAALLSGDRVLARAEEAMAKGQAERLMPLVAEVMAAAGKALSDLDAIGVGTGPGNFTGIRISVAAARGLALALGVPAVGVTRLEAMALDQPRPLLACVAAPRDQLYLQRFGAGVARGPEMAALDRLDGWALTGLTVTGDRADEVAARLGAAVTEEAPRAVAIARHAATRWRDPALPRPAPLYLRPADAAPSSAVPPAILPA
ncbi:tRNA (adenosine(37)-N6)-threonylcarbamoyltransferase complex dimerization subunit type 1 TsaB [Roseicyclus persicicus]|uniref:tRNA (Adenosine(37)-N6)-threonylcarbamoyltransferase complex dimerization subunit type 1 TsaB n=1 Tax=Roseicyclus persicicus TaxID=2650661 RepID=A0A7X6GVW3_9RHOB|nr:tRNA (adenosine(37)-N6)-threonylcarbamoyltransferase complex dimerization subunit type 1 TsaB [Roseibacterium persicicum]NKX43344.1 tRNA (adenosine(37)-N6)-threonylcarbamoyltransferase complex dimerization subunit type 1 TsaB [Roseibacterium persicicum]